MRKFPAAVIFKGFPGALRLLFNACRICKVGIEQVSGSFSFSVLYGVCSNFTKDNISFMLRDVVIPTCLFPEEASSWKVSP